MAKAEGIRRFVAAFDLHFGWEYRYERGRRIMSPTHSVDAIRALMAFAKDFRPDVFILGGDQLNCGPVSHWLKGKPRLVENFRLKDEMDLLEKYILAPVDSSQVVEKTWLRGNHDCVSEDTEIFTENGWTTYDKIADSAFVWSFNLETTKAELVPIDAVIVKDYVDQDMVVFSRKAFDALVTPGHNMIVKPKGSPKPWFLTEAKDCLDHHTIPVSAENENEDYDLTDEEVRLAAWLLTDSCLSKVGNSVTFYQSGPKHSIIENLLNDAYLDYVKTRRIRNTTEICGKKLKSILPSYEFRVNATCGSFLRSLIDNDKNQLPSWIWDLSTRQMRMFLEEFVTTDGTWYKSADRVGMAMIYCNRDKLRGQLAALCALCGVAVSEKKYGGKNWRLNLLFNKTERRLSTVTTQKYTGKVWCVSNRNHTMLVRRNGSIGYIGNCWVEDLVNETPGLEGLVEPENYLNLKARGWKVFSQGEIYKLGKLNFIHGDVLSPGKYRAKRLVEMYRRNIRCGHFHSYEAATDITPYDRKDFHTGIVVPAMAQCNAAYMKNGVSNHHQGFLYGWVAPDGTFTDHVMTIVNGRFIWNGKVYDGRSKR